MPQLNPAPWLSTMVLVWAVLLLLKSLLAFHHTSQSWTAPPTLHTNIWTWTWQ